MSATRYLAVDLGAESGRVMLGTLADGKLALEEIHRFPNRTAKKDGALRWDLAHLDTEIFRGLEKAGQRGEPIAGVSTDSWAVDYVAVDRNNAALGDPICYRDERTADSPARFFKKVPFAEVYAETGIQLLPFNTLYQFEAELGGKANALAGADRFLLIADYFNARFSGVGVIEQSMASTTQLYDPRTHAWSPHLIKTLGLAESLFPRIVPSGTVLGPVTGALKKNKALAETKVIASCSHDTGAAIAAVPAGKSPNWAYLSSGTWSLLGAELAAPVMTEAARTAGFTNEVGIGGTIRFLKNIAGLWMVQECRRAWEAEGNAYDYDEITLLAVASGPAPSFLSLADPRFVSAGGMPEKIAAYCRETGQPVPASAGQFVRVILESLALCYAETLSKLEELIGHRVETLHIVGGGSRNDLLNQLTADAIGRPVLTGPVEATAIGNLLVQARALGHLASDAELRRVVEASFPTRSFTPQPGISDTARQRFQQLAHLKP